MRKPAQGGLQAEWISLIGTFGLRRPRQGRDGVRLVKPYECIELPRQARLRVMAPALGVGTIDYSNETLQAGLGELLAQMRVPVLAQVEQKCGNAGAMGQPFVAVLAGGINMHDLHRRIPIARGGHGAAMRAEPDQGGVLPVFLAAKLADVDLLALEAHLGECGVADMRVV